jgi:uncharacterized protein (UPF0276 family)
MDLRWGDPAGFGLGPTGREAVAPALRAFLAREAHGFAHAFFSWQPRDRRRLRAEDYAPAWDDLAAALPPELPRALHHTALNLAALEPAARGPLLDFTNALCERYALRWINEDVGFWSLAGRPLPYPLPPVLDAAGLAACVRNARACQRGLDVPLVLEFPGFSAGVSLVMGDIDAYDFFRALAEETGAPVTLDVGHLLSWRWWRGLRGEALLDDVERLPLAHAFELHLSGCEIAGGRFHDVHHGRVLDEQLALLDRLLPLCPNLRAVTFEDPRLERDGALDAGSRDSLARLRAATESWSRTAPTPVAGVAAPARAVREESRAETHATLERDLDACLRGVATERPGPLATLADDELDAAAATWRAMVRDHAHRGTGRLADAFPRCVAAWRALHPDDEALDGLFARFLASPAIAAWRQQPGLEGGACLEACFAAFVAAEGLASPLVREEELLTAVLCALTVAPEPAFTPPPAVRRAPRGWFALSSAEPPVLHAAIDGRYVNGPVTPGVAAILRGDAGGAPAVRERLVEIGLLAS